MHILFVEDDAMNRRVVRDMLAVADISMDEAPDGQTGLDMIEAGVFDVLLFDLRMPGMDGLTAVRHLRARTDAKAELPCIIITADTRPNLHQECLAAGADDMLLKPVAMRDLFDTIGRVLAVRSGGAILFS